MKTMLTCMHSIGYTTGTERKAKQRSVRWTGRESGVKKSAISASIDADVYADGMRLSERHRMVGGRMTWGTSGHMAAIEMENTAQSQKASHSSAIRSFVLLLKGDDCGVNIHGCRI